MDGSGSNKRHAVPGAEPDIFQNPLEVPCLRRTGLWTIGTSSAAFLLRFYSTRSFGSALNMMIPIGVASSMFTWISCRREWKQKHDTMRTVQELRELEPKARRYRSLGPEDSEKKEAFRKEVAEKIVALRRLGVDLDNDQLIDPSMRALVLKVESEAATPPADSEHNGDA